MATRIINQATGRSSVELERRECPCASNCGCSGSCNCTAGDGCDCAMSCTRSVAFCETITLHESFDASCITAGCANIAYDTSFLGYTVEPMTMQASLPCGGCCPVDVYKITLTGAIPYIIDVGPVESGCGAQVRLSVAGSVMVDEPIGYLCGDTEPDLTELSCGNVTPHVCVEVSQCACSERENITVYGTFNFSNLPTCM